MNFFVLILATIILLALAGLFFVCALLLEIKRLNDESPDDNDI